MYNRSVLLNVCVYQLLHSLFVSLHSDITEEDLEESGVLDPTHKKILLESLRQQQQK